ncbi:MAG: recombination mediator RecR [Gemmatimonadales bacterium]|nr:recombination mediator RecR [Gemmatimonadales bacterium]MDZ4259824.1 recombination mediator RecR [Gemmatimonadales bacterium]MDZ4389358.1 recombination mediator RecR [Gemmatimonadales bacterium]
MSALDTLITEFARLPGIGRKTAQRLTYHLLQQPRERMSALAGALTVVAERVYPCEGCGQPTEEGHCTICRDPRRDAGLLCVVEEASAVAVLERAGVFRGRYVVLGGRLSPLDGIGPESLRVGLLEQRLREGEVVEVILATNSSMEGEATATWLQQVLAEWPGVRVSRLARGLPVGGELEYVDGVTLSHALTAREAL